MRLTVRCATVPATGTLTAAIPQLAQRPTDFALWRPPWRCSVRPVTMNASITSTRSCPTSPMYCFRSLAARELM